MEYVTCNYEDEEGHDEVDVEVVINTRRSSGGDGIAVAKK